jgi:gliding motility-associated-like protein
MFQGISPNGDGVNDRFTIPEIEYYPNNNIQIMNRWGTVVFERKGYLNEFVGLNEKGESLPDGTYFYVLDLGNGQKPVKGYLVINR